VDKPEWDLHQGNPDSKDCLASAEMVSQHQQRVSELQVGNPLNARAHPGIANHGASDEATGPPLRRGPQGKFGLFAVGEVPLIEQSDLFDTRSTRQHERAMRVAGGLEPAIDRRRCVDGAEVRIDHGDCAVAHVGTCQPDPIPALQFSQHGCERVRIWERIVGGNGDPLARVGVKPAPQTDICTGAEPEVCAGGDQLCVANKRRKAAHGVLVRSVVDHDDRGRHRLLCEGGDRPTDGIGPVSMNYDNGDERGHGSQPAATAAERKRGSLAPHPSALACMAGARWFKGESLSEDRQAWLPPHITAAERVHKIGDLAAEGGIERVDMLAWRDLADVEAGGSELHASEVASRWAEAGLDVTMRTSYAQGSPPRSVRDGYEVIRRAGRYAIFPRAVGAELLRRHGRRDALVEIWNGVPFFSPIWARGPRATWLHHVHEDMWPMVLPAPLARAGQMLERRIAPPFYRRTPIVTLSESSRRHIMERLRLPAERLHVVPPGVDVRFTPGPSATTPLVAAVGRLMPAKGFPSLVRALAEVRRAVPEVELVIVGEGYERERIEGTIREFDAESWVTMPGRLSDDAIVDLYRRAWVVASASRAEGWGMTLTEAAACGTPAVATDIPGHRDAVAQNETGLLVEREADMAGAITRLLTDEQLRRRMGEAATSRSDLFRWERTAYETLAVLAGHRDR